MKVQIGPRMVGDHEPAMLVAELSLNHGGSIDTALEMVRAAAASGADAVKVQCFTASTFCTEAATYKGERQIDLFRRHELSAVAFSAIADECKRQGVIFFGTPDSLEQARLLVALGAPAMKIGSDDIIHVPLLRQVAALGLPMILSTGMANVHEIEDAIEATAGVPVILLHCVSSYPTAPADANLLRMLHLRGYGAPVGYSDHTDGIDAAVGAAWLGACLIEKHFTLDRHAPGPDHAFSADPGQWRALVLHVRHAEQMRGHGHLADESPAVLEMRVAARRSVVAARAIAQGEIIRDDDLAYKRPGDGLPPVAGARIVGHRASRALVVDEQIRKGDWT